MGHHRSPSNSKLQLDLVSSPNDVLSPNDALSPYTPGFNLPCGWGVQQVLRPDGIHSDTYYYEAGTGRKFRSTREIERYLNGNGYPPTTRSSSRSITKSSSQVSGLKRMLISSEKFSASKTKKMLVSGGKLLTLDGELEVKPSRKAPPAAPSVIPEGWIVEEVPRRHSSTAKDRYYYEPDSGAKFRSLVGVQRYLAELEENAPLSKALEEIKENQPLSKVFKTKPNLKKYTRRKFTVSKENVQASHNFDDPPVKVKWILGSSKGDTWDPYISETVMVQDSVKKEWTNRFTMFMNDEMTS